MHEQQGQQPTSMSEKVNMLVGICQILSKIGNVFWRRPGTWGCRHANVQMVLSYFVLFCFGPLFYPHENPRPMLGVFSAATVLLLVHRIAGVRDTRRKHSQYTGQSWFPGDERRAKGALEPLATLVLAAICASVSRPLAAYLIMVAITSFLSAAWMIQAHQARIREVLDAQRDAELMQRELQQRLGE